MQNLVETLSIAASSLALFIIVLISILNIYMIKRNGFYVNANCWFCNSWTKVLYANRNSFDCPSCLQYNGFDGDGGYNKVIEAQHTQHNTSFNKYKTAAKTEPYGNGLCTYCNNNQQLKVYQLAHFTPINEDTYDIEIEHFQKQLEKAYKLCKKCENVLKTTIDKKNAWIFGDRLRSLRKKGLALLDLTKSSDGISKEVKQSFCFKMIKYTLIAFIILVLCQIFNVKIDYQSRNVKKLIPKPFAQYNIILEDFYSRIFKVSKLLDDEINNLNNYMPKNVKLQTSNLLPITSVGFLLESILLIWNKNDVFWKINGILGWMILLISSSVSLDEDYIIYISALQVGSALTLLYGHLAYKEETKKRNISNKKFHFKKIKKTLEASDSSEDETDDVPSSPGSSTKSRKSEKTYCNQSCRSSSPMPHFGKSTRNTANLNCSFATVKSAATTASFLDNCVNNVNSGSLHSDLNRSLDNLTLNNLNFQPQPCTSPVFSVSSVRKPIISPPKLKNITQNPWTAGGFWKNDTNILSVAADHTNLSRSSSQSSGFVSTNDPINNQFSSLPTSREPSLSGDMDRASILSEPAYHFTPINSNVGQSSGHQQLYYKADNNTFYPVLNQNNMLFIQNGVPHHHLQNNLGNVSLRSFNTRSSSLRSPPLFGENPTRSLFKGLNGESNSISKTTSF